jgi:chromate transport protein ChrA
VFGPAERVVPTNLELPAFSWKAGSIIIAAFFAFFVVIMILRGTLHSPLIGFRVFANLFLAGTIIFGGGPVVIPLLREYVVVEGWVSPRDFLLGLAICQAFPGPNFNFAVYLGALAVAGQLNPATGATIGYLAMFAPGIILHTGSIGLWKVLRNRAWFISCLRGINATAVGLIYTAVYRLWEQGFLSEAFTSGSSLGLDPWWIVVAATSFFGGRWFNITAPLAILLGGVMGMIWYGVITA